MNTSPVKPFSRELTLFIWSAVFLFNPCINIIDFLPDFVGYLLLSKALYRLSLLSPAIDEAQVNIRKLRAIMLLKLISVSLVPMFDDTFKLLLTSVFVVLELVFAIPVINRIFDGLEYLGTRFDGRAIYKGMKNAKSFTYVLFIGRAAFTLFPELCAIGVTDSNNAGYVTSGYHYSFEVFRKYLYIIGIPLVLVAGIFWLVNIIRYAKGIASETAFNQRMADAYAEKIALDKNIEMHRYVRTAFTLTSVAFIFLIDFWLDDFNVIPSVICPVILAFAIRAVSKQNFNTVLIRYVNAAYFLISAVSLVFTLLFSLNYGIAVTALDITAYNAFFRMNIFKAVETLVSVAAVVFMLTNIRKIAYRYLLPDKNVSDKRLRAIYKSQLSETDRTVVILMVAYVIVAVINIVFTFIRSAELPAIWLIPSGLTLIWVIAAFSVLSRVYDKIEYKLL